MLASFLTALLIVLQVPLLLAFTYLLFLSVSGLFYRPKMSSGAPPRTRFAIMVPAHNEERLLPRLLESLSAAEYPPGLRQVFVVSDNSTDATARVASEHGAAVFERTNTQQVGKGYALNWLLSRIRQSGAACDAYVVLDADCTVSENFFAAMDARLQGGDRVLQSYYAVANPAQSWVSGLRYIAIALLHHSRPSGREVLGLSCGLFGTGMVFKSELLEELGWSTHGLVEDVEYFFRLTEGGVQVRFVREAVVWSPMPASLREARSQNERWERGRLQVITRFGPKLLLLGLRRRTFALIDPVIENAIPPLAVSGAGALALLALSVVWGRPAAVAIGSAGLAALLGHVLVGLLAARAPGRVYLALVFAPWFVAWKLGLYVRAMLPGKRGWVRTTRPE